jgi:hypothetical protein
VAAAAWLVGLFPLSGARRRAWTGTCRQRLVCSPSARSGERAVVVIVASCSVSLRVTRIGPICPNTTRRRTAPSTSPSSLPAPSRVTNPSPSSPRPYQIPSPSPNPTPSPSPHAHCRTHGTTPSPHRALQHPPTRLDLRYGPSRDRHSIAPLSHAIPHAHDKSGHRKPIPCWYPTLPPPHHYQPTHLPFTALRRDMLRRRLLASRPTARNLCGLNQTHAHTHTHMG